jgi:hypothetical protein
MCLALVGLGVASRLMKEALGLSLPNFHAVAAASLFAGFYFSARAGAAGRVWAFATPLGAMVVSDCILGGYEPLVMTAVYGSLLLPAALGLIVGGRALWLCAPLAMTSTLVFFLLTNLAVWQAWYSHDLAGLARCFTRALPFLKFSLAGDLAFTLALFGGYALATGSVGRRDESTAAALPARAT